jgi:hypothetical protein
VGDRGLRVGFIRLLPEVARAVEVALGMGLDLVISVDCRAVRVRLWLPSTRGGVDAWCEGGRSVEVEGKSGWK